MSYLISDRIRAATLGAVLLGGVAAPLCFLRADERPPAGEFLRRVVAGELRAQAEDHSHISKQAHASDRRRSATERHGAAMKAVRTKAAKKRGQSAGHPVGTRRTGTRE